MNPELFYFTTIVFSYDTRVVQDWKLKFRLASVQSPSLEEGVRRVEIRSILISTAVALEHFLSRPGPKNPGHLLAAYVLSCLVDVG